VTPRVFEEALDKAMKKKPLDAISRVRLERLDEGVAAQIQHVGPCADEGPRSNGCTCLSPNRATNEPANITRST
jgi:hypothetical protein